MITKFKIFENEDDRPNYVTVGESPFYEWIRKNETDFFSTANFVKKYPYVKMIKPSQLLDLVMKIYPNDKKKQRALIEEILLNKFIFIFGVYGKKRFTLKDIKFDKNIVTLTSPTKEYEIDVDDVIVIYCKDLNVGPLESFATTINNYNL